MVEDSEERYPGEARGLALFLAHIRPESERLLGGDSMLTHAIRRALASRSLARLRQARRLFNRLPRELRRRLVEAAVLRERACPTAAGHRQAATAGEGCAAAAGWRGHPARGEVVALPRDGAFGKGGSGRPRRENATGDRAPRP